MKREEFDRQIGDKLFALVEKTEGLVFESHQCLWCEAVPTVEVLAFVKDKTGVWEIPDGGPHNDETQGIALKMEGWHFYRIRKWSKDSPADRSSKTVLLCDSCSKDSGLEYESIDGGTGSGMVGHGKLKESARPSPAEMKLEKGDAEEEDEGVNRPSLEERDLTSGNEDEE
jgi:hypothetical protein